jgi:polysaccharide export outer membrane protein
MVIDVLLSLALAAGALQAPAQTASTPPADAVPAQQAAAAADTPKRQVADTYPIGPNDVLSISCRQDATITGKYRVEEGGSINLPYIGRIVAGGRTIAQLQLDLTRAYGDYIRNPEIFVDVDAYKSQSVMVTGAVRQPQRVQMQGQLTLLDALVAARSPTSDAGDEIQIAHRSDIVDSANATATISPDDPNIVRIKRSTLNLGRNNIVLLDGDIVYVTPAQHFTMTGQVKNSGTYVWQEGMTIEQAIALAGGLTERGSTRSISAHRLIKGKMTDVDLKMQDKVQPDDVIKVGNRLF